MEKRLGHHFRTLERKSNLLATISNMNRLHILELLAAREMSVGELAEHIELSQSATSQHLAILRNEKIVAVRRVSQVKYYSLESQAARTLLALLAELFEPQSRLGVGAG